MASFVVYMESCLGDEEYSLGPVKSLRVSVAAKYYKTSARVYEDTACFADFMARFYEVLARIYEGLFRF